VAYKCPRCANDVSRHSSSGAQAAAGIVGLLFAAAFGPFNCKSCGKIGFGEFPSDVRTKMTLGSIGMVLGAVVLLVVILAVLLKLG
jgi:endogenous inhibitor of DNA gyrase (YacG/DUF329 family)